MTHPPIAPPISPDMDAGPLQSASNFRDLGGLRGADGRAVRHGRVFRSDHLAALTPADTDQLRRLGVRYSIDFRGVRERAQHAYAVEGLQVLSFAIEPTVVQRVTQLLRRGRIPSADETVELMCDTYRGFVQSHGPTFGRFLRHLLEQPVPTVFHCTAGKDRTGFAAALLLEILGVERDAILHDYLLTNQRYRRQPSVEGQAPAHVLEVLWQVRPAFLQAAWDAVDRHHGGMARYLAGPVGMTQAQCNQLRRQLLTA